MKPLKVKFICGFISQDLIDEHIKDKSIIFPEYGKAPLEIKTIAGKMLQSSKDLIILTQSDHLINMFRYFKLKKIVKNMSITYFDEKSVAHILFVNDVGRFVNEQMKEIKFPSGFFDATLEELYEMY